MIIRNLTCIGFVYGTDWTPVSISRWVLHSWCRGPLVKGQHVYLQWSGPPAESGAPIRDAFRPLSWSMVMNVNWCNEGVRVIKGPILHTVKIEFWTVETLQHGRKLGLKWLYSVFYSFFECSVAMCSKWKQRVGTCHPADDQPLRNVRDFVPSNSTLWRRAWKWLKGQSRRLRPRQVLPSWEA